uniref:HTH_48 domain-containing protein n=2 Tax=Caenorhabditis japonica TaxID=281687 RepID=A0A8R1I1C4_CAEJA
MGDCEISLENYVEMMVNSQNDQALLLQQFQLFDGIFHKATFASKWVAEALQAISSLLPKNDHQIFMDQVTHRFRSSTEKNIAQIENKYFLAYLQNERSEAFTEVSALNVSKRMSRQLSFAYINKNPSPTKSHNRKPTLLAITSTFPNCLSLSQTPWTISVLTQITLRHVILFLFLSNLKVPETHRRLVQVYKAEAPHENTIRIWFGKFENNDFFLNDASHSGLSVWWSVHGVHHWELLDEGKTITAEYYSAQLQKIRTQLDLSPLKCHRVHYIDDNAKTTCGENNKVTAGNVQLDSSCSPIVQPRPCPY